MQHEENVHEAAESNQFGQSVLKFPLAFVGVGRQLDRLFVNGQCLEKQVLQPSG